MSRSALIVCVAIVAAAAFTVYFARARRAVPDSAGVPAEMPFTETGSTERIAPPASDPVESVVELTEASELPSSRRVALPDEPIRARPGEAAVAPEPKLFARVTVTAVLPPGVAPSSNVWRNVEAVLWRYRDPHSHDWYARHVEIADQARSDNGTFEFTRVPVDVAFELAIEPSFGPTWVTRLEPLSAGTRLEIRAELKAGIRISGQVVDENAVPIQGARMSARSARTSSSEESHFALADKASITDASGSFLFEGLARVDWLIQAHHHSISDSEEWLAAGSGGDVRGLVLTVERRGSIEGRVTWPDGRPATWSEVRAARNPRESSSTIATDGTFRFTLSRGTYDIDVVAKAKGVRAIARAEDVATGGAPLHIVLEETATFELRGIVDNAEGAAVEQFSVGWHGLGGARGRFEASNGTFVLDGLLPGEFEIDVRASGYLSVEQRVVVGAEHSVPMRFVLPRVGVVRGRVVDSHGRAVSDASVSGLDSGVASRSRADGRFELRPDVVRVSLCAGKSGYAQSEPIELEVAPQSVVEGVVLRLREPGRVVGRVLDPAGGGVRDASVGGWREDEMLSHDRSDGEGRFVLEDLPPGPVRILASTPGDAPAEVEAETQVTAGGTSVVELRFERMNSVRVSGRIERSGRPMACWIVLRSGTSTADGRSGPGGNLDVLVPRSGTWKALLYREGDSPEAEHADRRLFTFEVPESGLEDVELDFDALPRARSFADLGQ